MSEITEISCDILRSTRDGDNLHSTDLRLIEDGANHNLNESGIKELRELHRIVMSGEYNRGDRWV